MSSPSFTLTTRSSSSGTPGRSPGDWLAGGGGEGPGGEGPGDGGSVGVGGAGGPAPQPISLLMSGLVQAVEAAEWTFQGHQSLRWEERHPGATSPETGSPEAVRELVPRLGVTRATFTFWAEPSGVRLHLPPDASFLTKAWLRIRWFVRRTRRLLRTSSYRLPPQWTDLVAPVRGNWRGAIRLVLVVERRDDHRFVATLTPNLASTWEEGRS